jgi:hypothetical protein
VPHPSHRRLVVVASLFFAAPSLAQDTPYEEEEQDARREPHMASPADAQPVLVPDTEQAQAERSGAMINGRLREGAFLSGPGSLTFVLHHTILGAAGGLVTQSMAGGQKFDLSLASRERMLAGTLIGAGLGFGFSAWWQANNWIDRPAAHYGIVNSVVSGLFFLGIADLFTNDALALAWTGFLGAELGAWLTATIGTGELPVNQGLLIASGAGWGTAYAGLLLAILGTTGTRLSAERVFDVLAISAGIGGGAMALATMNYRPTTAQILRADLFGAGVGGAVLGLSMLVLGPSQPTPYALALVSSAGAITAVSLLWEEAAERRPAERGAAFYYRSREKDRPYASVWW